MNLGRSVGLAKQCKVSISGTCHRVDPIPISFNGWAVTLIDSLDTLLIMGMMDEYEKAVSFVADLHFDMPEVRPSISRVEHAPTFDREPVFFPV